MPRPDGKLQPFGQCPVVDSNHRCIKVAVLQTAAIAAMHNEAKEQTPGIEPGNQKSVPAGLQSQHA